MTPNPTVKAPSGWATVKPQESPHQDGWLSDVDATDRASATLAVGCKAAPSLDGMTPVNAREGILDRSGEPGVALVLGFADESSAARFQKAWIDQMHACSSDVVTQVASEQGYWAGHHVIDGATWTESSKMTGQQVSFIAVQGKLSAEQTRTLMAAQQ